jgi:hypothetical protein
MILSVHKNILFAVLIGLAILCVGLLLMHTASPLHRDAVASGFMADIVITFPVAFYFMVIRPLRLRKWGILLVITCSCTVAYLILPAHQRHYIIALRELIALPELALLIYTLSKIRLIRREYRRLQTDLPDVAYNVHKSMATVLGNGTGIKIIASEITILRFALLFWKRPVYPTNTKRLTIHRELGYAALFGVILAVCAIELVAFHLFLLHYSHTAALIVTIFSGYGTLFLIGDFAAIIKSPVMLIGDRLLLRTGLRWRALVSLGNIAAIQKVSENHQPAETCFNGALMKNRANILFTFSQPIQIERLYRKPTSTTQILMTIDEVEELIGLLN